MAIIHGIFTAFDANPSLVVCGAFLDLSRAFNRVKHEELFYKFKRNGIDGSDLCLLQSL